jgi:Transposase DDE domain
VALSIAHLAPALQTLFTAEADRLAEQTGFCRRRRRLTGPAFARAAVFTWLARPDAPVEEIAAALDRPVSPQALAARLASPAGGDLLQALLRAAVGTALGAAPEAIPLLRRFRGVYAEDMTDLGAGGGKALVRYELSGGAPTALEVHPTGTGEAPAARALPPLPAGSLRLADRGFFDAAELRRLTGAAVSWVTRVPTGVRVAVGGADRFEPLAEWLARQAGDRLDVPARACASDPVAGRLVARRCPPAVADRRRRQLTRTARRKGRPVSARQGVLCGWSVLLTNLPVAGYGAAELEVLYRCRWQVELLFKRFKSLGGVGASRGRRPGRLRAEVLAKLLAAVVAEWVALLGGGPLARTSPAARQRRVRAAAVRLARALASAEELGALLRELAGAFARLGRRRRRRHSPSTRQLLFRPRLAS